MTDTASKHMSSATEQQNLSLMFLMRLTLTPPKDLFLSIVKYFFSLFDILIFFEI